jgi:hypothetical protein
VAGGLSKASLAGIWAKLAVVRRAQQAAVAKERTNIIDLSFSGFRTLDFYCIRVIEDNFLMLDWSSAAVNLSFYPYRARLEERARSSAG